MQGKATWCAIHAAAALGDSEVLGLLIERDHSCIAARATRGTTALHFAAYHGRLPALLFLIAHGADVHAIDDDGFTALDDVIERRGYARLALKCTCAQEDAPAASEFRTHVEAIAIMLEKADRFPTSGETRAWAWSEWQRWATRTLVQATERGDTGAVARLLDIKGDVNARDVDGSALIHAASDEGHTATLKLLLDRGANIHTRNNYQDTPLHSSARRGQLAATCLLITRGADVLARNRFGKTPAEWARQERQGHWLATLVTLHAAFACLHATAACRQSHEHDLGSFAKPSNAADRPEETNRLVLV